MSDDDDVDDLTELYAHLLSQYPRSFKNAYVRLLYNQDHYGALKSLVAELDLLRQQKQSGPSVAGSCRRVNALLGLDPGDKTFPPLLLVHALAPYLDHVAAARKVNPSFVLPARLRIAQCVKEDQVQIYERLMKSLGLCGESVTGAENDGDSSIEMKTSKSASDGEKTAKSEWTPTLDTMEACNRVDSWLCGGWSHHGMEKIEPEPPKELDTEGDHPMPAAGSSTSSHSKSDFKREPLSIMTDVICQCLGEWLRDMYSYLHGGKAPTSKQEVKGPMLAVLRTCFHLTILVLHHGGISVWANGGVVFADGNLASLVVGFSNGPRNWDIVQHSSVFDLWGSSHGHPSLGPSSPSDSIRATFFVDLCLTTLFFSPHPTLFVPAIRYASQLLNIRMPVECFFECLRNMGIDAAIPKDLDTVGRWLVAVRSYLKTLIVKRGYMSGPKGPGLLSLDLGQRCAKFSFAPPTSDRLLNKMLVKEAKSQKTAKSLLRRRQRALEKEVADLAMELDRPGPSDPTRAATPDAAPSIAISSGDAQVSKEDITMDTMETTEASPREEELSAGGTPEDKSKTTERSTAEEDTPVDNDMVVDDNVPANSVLPADAMSTNIDTSKNQDPSPSPSPAPSPSPPPLPTRSGLSAKAKGKRRAHDDVFAFDEEAVSVEEKVERGAGWADSQVRIRRSDRGNHQKAWIKEQDRLQKELEDYLRRERAIDESDTEDKTDSDEEDDEILAVRLSPTQLAVLTALKAEANQLRANAAAAAAAARIPTPQPPPPPPPYDPANHGQPARPASPLPPPPTSMDQASSRRNYVHPDRRGPWTE